MFWVFLKRFLWFEIWDFLNVTIYLIKSVRTREPYKCAAGGSNVINILQSSWEVGRRAITKTENILLFIS